jgi:ATP-dependent exoDNAse (exonuclease V) beta subunit
MTIHKSKGLEFPVVLFPYADLNIYDTRSETVWYPLDSEINSGFSEAQINYKKELASYSEIGAALYNERRNMLQLDNLNLLYVTLTRAVEQLYIFSEMPSKKSAETTTYNQFFSEFLQEQSKWIDGQLIYEFGTPQRTAITKVKEKIAHRIPKYLATTPEDHQLKIVTAEASLWDTTAQNAIQQGNILHDIMAEIRTTTDIDPYFESISKRSIYSSEELETLYAKVRSIATHPKLKHLFENTAEVRNEGDIITSTGLLLRPDRLNILASDLVTIVDYKTGTPNYHHEDQINSYATALEQMGKKISEKLLVYTSGEEITINKV